MSEDLHAHDIVLRLRPDADGRVVVMLDHVGRWLRVSGTAEPASVATTVGMLTQDLLGRLRIPSDDGGQRTPWEDRVMVMSRGPQVATVADHKGMTLLVVAGHDPRDCRLLDRLTTLLSRFQASADSRRPMLGVMVAKNAGERGQLLQDALADPNIRETVFFDASTPTVTIHRRVNDIVEGGGWVSPEPLGSAGRLYIAAWDVDLAIADLYSGLMPE